MVICPVDSTITEQRISHLSAYSRSGTQLYSSDYAASSTVDANVLNQFQHLSNMVFNWVRFVPDLLTFAYATTFFTSALLYEVRTVD